MALLFAGIAEGFGLSMLLPLLSLALDTPNGPDIADLQPKSTLEQLVSGFFDTVGDPDNWCFADYFCDKHSVKSHPRLVVK